MKTRSGTIRFAPVDLGALTFADAPSGAGRKVSTFLAVPYGEWEHPVYGDIAFFAEKATRMVRNFSENVVGVDLAIDYSHENQKRAAGWITGMAAGKEGVEFTVEWTPAGAQALADGEFRYFSPEYAPCWTHPLSGGREYEDVLLGGGLTNRPFLKGKPGGPQTEVTLAEGAPLPSEYARYLGPEPRAPQPEEDGKGDGMTLAEFLGIFGLKPEAKPEEIRQKFAVAETPGDTPADGQGEEGAEEHAGLGLPARSENISAADKKKKPAAGAPCPAMAEGDPETARKLAALEAANIALAEQVKALHQARADEAAAAKTSAAEAAVMAAINEGRLPGSVREDAEKFSKLVKLAETDSEAWGTLVASIAPIPGLTPKGAASVPGSQTFGPSPLLAAYNRYKAQGMSAADAYSRAAAENPAERKAALQGRSEVN